MPNTDHALLIALLSTLTATAGPVFAQEEEATPTGEEPAPLQTAARSPVEFFIDGGGVYQFQADVENGGDFSVSRLYVEPGLTWIPNDKLSVSFSAGFSYDNYDFGGAGLGGVDPWDDVFGLRFSASVRWAIDDRWTVFAVPTIRSAVESGADLNDGLFGGGFAGFSYRINDKLTIGPGIGYLTQIEDSASIFPVLILNWQFTDTLSLQTGRGMGATQGPGLSLVWDFADKWEFIFGARYERQRWRLDDKGVAPDGVGQEQSIPVFAGVTWSFTPKANVSLLGGANFFGELKLEDDGGRTLIKDDYDPAFFLGLTFRVRF